MQATIHVGTSGWQHKHWKGVFYPHSLKSQDWLAYYAQHFDCVEVGSSFYELPSTDAVSDWCRCVPDEVYGLLKCRSAAFCIFDGDGSTAPLIADGDLVYLRLHGPGSAYAGNYRAPGLRRWVDRAHGWKRQSKEVFLFFDNDEKGYAAKNGTRTIGLLKAA